MTRLPTDPYTGPPPIYAVGATVYHQGASYTVSAVCGRAPGVGWVYELDGPGELLRVGEREISCVRPALVYQVTERRPGQPPRSYQVTADLQALWQAAADFERAVAAIQALSGLPAAVCRRVAERYPRDVGHLIDAIKRGYVRVTPDGGVQTRPGWWVQATDPTAPPPILAGTPAPPPPRLNRRARRAKHRPWTPPAR